MSGVNKNQFATPPRGLGAAGKAFWSQSVREYEFESAHEHELLRLACQALDRVEQARKTVAREPYIEGRYGLKPHPAMLVERNSTLVFSRLVRQLGLGPEVPAATTNGARRPYEVKLK